MTTPTRTCSLDIAEETLSALRDGLLGTGERQQLTAHVPTCATCQRRLAQFEGIERMLRGQREPNIQARVWRGIYPHLVGAGGRRTAHNRGPFLRGGLGVVAAVLLVALFGVVLANRLPGQPANPSVTSAVPTATIVPTQTAMPTSTISANGLSGDWRTTQAGTGIDLDIAFAPTAPATGYAVVVGQDGTATVNTTHNAGATWQKSHFAASGQDNCEVSVDPTDAQDVVVVCTTPAGSGYTVLRSFDGGATWLQPKLGVTVNCYAQMGWAGSTLLMAFILCESPTSETQLIASVNQKAFVRLDSGGKVSGITLDANIRLLTGHGSTYYVQMGAIQYNPLQLSDSLLVSKDGGVTWKTETLTDGGRRLHLYGISADGRRWTAVYQDAPSQLALSMDDGQSWSKYPAPWSNETGPNDVLVTPDGTAFVTDLRALYDTNIPNTVYMAAPGAASWKEVTVVAGLREAHLRAVAYDASGHPKALWALLLANTQNGSLGLITYPL